MGESTREDRVRGHAPEEALPEEEKQGMMESLSTPKSFNTAYYKNAEVDADIKNALHQIHGSIEIGGQEHFYLEGQAAFALPQDNGDMFVHCST